MYSVYLQYDQAVHGILMWHLNILDENTSLPNKAGDKYLQLYKEEWRSSQTCQGSSTGTRFRGFLGDYSMKVLHGSEVLSELEFTLDEDLQIACSGDSSNLHCHL